MKTNNNSKATILYQKAEELLRKHTPENVLKHSEKETVKLIQKLEDNQLKMISLRQKLRKAKEQGQVAVQKYNELYDLTPLGYFTLSREGEIIEVNVAGANMLGKERLNLENKKFGSFLTEDTKSTFDAFLHEVFTGQTDGTCEVGLLFTYKPPIYVHISGLQAKNSERCLVTVVDISGRKQADHLLRKNEEKYRLLFQNMTTGYALHEVMSNPEGRPCNYRFLEINAAFEMLTGLKAVHVVGKTVGEVMPGTGPYWIELYGQVALTGKPVSFENYSSELNKYFQITSYSPEPGKFAALFHDITERKQSEKQFKLLNRAIEQSPVTVVITDKEGNIEYVNPKFIELTGYPMEEVVGKNPRFLQSGRQTMEFYQNLWETILSGNDWHGEFQNRKKNGDIYWESAVISSIVDDQGEIAFFIAVKEDITEKKRMLQDLIKAKEKAEESDRLKSAFLTNISHEIRTPMNGILGFTDLLKEPNLKGEVKQEYISYIEESGARMLNIINDIIVISKIETELINVSVSETNVNEQVECIYSRFRSEVEQNNIRFSFKNTLPAKESIVKTDREKVNAIITNLVKNAIKFTKTGSIEFGYEKKGGQLEFFVKDTGVGIQKEQMRIIFERFRQGNESLSRSYEGAGLGLSISKAYVEMLEGKIWVESEEGKGSTFFFTIPYTNSVRS